MAVARREKTPQADLDYGLDWSDWVTSPEEINLVEWAAEPADGSLSFSSQSIEVNGTQTWTFISGGEDGVTYTITATAFTDNTPPRKAARSFLLTVRTPIYVEEVA